MGLTTGIRFCYPMIVALLLLIISSVPIFVVGLASFFPVVDLIVIYYWASTRPRVLPDWFILILGILRDGIEGSTLGISACIYLLVKYAVKTSRNLYRRGGFVAVWQGFAIAAIIGIAGKWLLISFFMDKPVSLDFAIMQLIFSIAMYPVFYWFLNLVNITVPDHYNDA